MTKQDVKSMITDFIGLSMIVGTALILWVTLP